MNIGMRNQIVVAVALITMAMPLSAADVADRLSEIRLPVGFSISLWADDVPKARSMTRSDNGIIYVGTRTDNVVYALRDTDGDGQADARHVVARDLVMPNGVAWRDGDLYIGERHRIIRLDDIDTRLDNPPEPRVIRDGLPDERHHGWRYIAFGPDDWLYVAIGAPCNVCNEPDPFATISRMRADGSDFQVYARGVRNSVGFDWHPDTGDLWFTDNGRDWMGDNLPPCELNRATEPGQHFGFPYCHAGAIEDPEFGKRGVCDRYVAPVQALGPHVAPLGVHFYRGEVFGADYHHQPLIAEHGSWNRSEKIGYRITRVVLDDDRNAVEYKTFAAGWLDGEEAWGRPVDLLELPDGSLLVSDDQAGVIYRITRSKRR